MDPVRQEGKVEDRLLTRTEVEALIRMSRSAIYRLMRTGQFPEPLRIGPRAVRWKRSEVEHWLESRPRATGDQATG